MLVQAGLRYEIKSSSDYKNVRERTPNAASRAPQRVTLLYTTRRAQLILERDVARRIDGVLSKECWIEHSKGQRPSIQRRNAGCIVRGVCTLWEEMVV